MATSLPGRWRRRRIRPRCSRPRSTAFVPVAVAAAGRFSPPAALPCAIIVKVRPKARDIRFHELLLTSEDRSLRAAAALEKQAKQIGRGLGLRIAGFAPGMILIAGEIAGAWSRFGPVIDREAAGFRVAGAPPRILPAHEGEIARLPGAAAPSSSAIARSRRQRGPSRRAAEKALRSSPNADPQTFSTQMRPSRELASRVVSPHPLKQRSKSIRLP